MPAPKNTSPVFVEEWNNTLQQLQAAEISTRDLEQAGIPRRTFQRHKNRPGGPLDTRATRHILKLIKPLIVSRAAEAGEKAKRLALLVKQNKLVLEVTMAGAATLLVLHAGMHAAELCHCLFGTHI